MHSQRETANGGYFTSGLSGTKFPYAHDRAGANKRAALSKLKAADAAIRDANNARALPILNRELSESEHRSGKWLPDTRTTRERVAQDATHKTSNRGDDSRNPHAKRIQELEAGLATAFNPADRARLTKRLNLAHHESTKWDNKRAEKLAWEARMSAPAVADAIVDGKAWLARLTTNPNVPQSWVNDARQRLADLQLTGETEAYWDATLAFEKTREQVLGERAAALDDAAAKSRAEAAEVRREKAADHLEPSPEPEPVAAESAAV